MSNFNYQDELKKIITKKQLVEINVEGDDERSTSYLMAVNDEYLVFARVTNDGTLDGVTIALAGDLESIQTETRFTKALSNMMKGDSVYEEAQKLLQSVKKMSFAGFISAFKDTQVLVDIRTSDNAFTGKVVDFDAEILVLNEIYVEEKQPFARTYLNPRLITSITVGSRWLKVISASQE